jgi:hypothetical protein
MASTNSNKTGCIQTLWRRLWRGSIETISRFWPTIS